MMHTPTQTEALVLTLTTSVASPALRLTGAWASPTSDLSGIIPCVCVCVCVCVCTPTHASAFTYTMEPQQFGTSIFPVSREVFISKW